MNTTGNTDNIRSICHRLITVVPGPNPWRWDEEFNVARIVFRKSGADIVLSELKQIFEHCYDFSTIERASADVDRFINSIFGIIPGQMVFTSNTSDGLILFAAWWPWGNEMDISLRVGLYSAANPSKDKSGLEKLLNEWFHL
ncbi:MAG: hypothetical protein ACOZF0_20540 [Thermodesulfobacteriota bacterium]